MRTGRYSISELFGNRHLEQLVIPEIQRDYVWTPVQVQGLLTSILTNFQSWRQEVDNRLITLEFHNGTPPNVEVDALQKDFLDFYSRRAHATNVGFVYAYSDADLPGQHFLIDGQQRLTTVYLTLLAVAASHSHLKSRFRSRYQLAQGDSSTATVTPALTRLDYRLREHTADFLHHMVSFLLEHGGAADDLENQAWCLAEAVRDTTTRNLMQNYQETRKLLNQVLTNIEQATYFYEYVEDLVDCWYFDTNESAQGEELYLYLNARGEAIADNENQKAHLLRGLTSVEKKIWGARWEEWQDVFWSHRNTGLETLGNPNADRGFNCFLSSHHGLSKLRNLPSSTNLEKLESIEQHIGIMRWMEVQKEAFKCQYSYTDWVDLWFEDLWEAINDKAATQWEILPGSHITDRDQNRQTLVWGTLLCVLLAIEKAGGTMAQLELNQLFRAIRVFYLLSYSGGRSSKVLPRLARIVFTESESEVGKNDGLGETVLKWRFLKQFSGTEQKEVESVIWKIEDHELNLLADNFGGLNLIHLVNLEDRNLNLDRLRRIRDEFYKLFPDKWTSENSAQKKKLTCVLMSYGSFWHQETPMYYQNFNFGDWKRTVRGRGSAEQSRGTQSVFKQFFDEFVAAQESLDVFLERKLQAIKQLPIDPATETDFRSACLWYARQLKEDLFSTGLYLTAGSTWNSNSDAHFTGMRELWNTNGSFRSNFIQLSHQLKRLA